MSPSVRRHAGIALLALATLAAIRVWLTFDPTPAPSPAENPGGNSHVPNAGSRPSGLEARERRAAETVWAQEILAQECARTIERLWETINAATNKLRAAAALEAGELVWGSWQRTQEPLPHGIEMWAAGTERTTLPWREWRLRLEGVERAGWKLVQVEFRHNRFDVDEAGGPRQSRFYFSAHLIHPLLSGAERAILEGDLVVDWQAGPMGGEAATIRRVDASGLTIKSRRGDPPFQCVLNETIAPPAERFSIDPLLLYDLDGDGLSEIILPSVNRYYRQDDNGLYRSRTLCRFPPGVIFTAVMADFNGDGAPDLLAARAEGLVLYEGGDTIVEGFEEPERLVWRAEEPLKNPMAFTCGDVDRDEDLDLFLGQYRVPTMGQVLKPWYYDANDGYPAYLLLNDGTGRFTDATAGSGLEPKRLRRTYTASLADLDADGHLDLMVVSDFAGIDLYRNRGDGHFTDVTSEWVADPKGFGMAHALADFNADGRLDVLMVGMNSPTVDRLEHLGLRRPGSREDFLMRPRMAFGNRLFMAKPGGGFEQTALNAGIARTGWSWGCSAADLDNDGFPDVYIANGLQSQASVRDFEPEFWLHDLYVDETVDDQEATRYFMDKFARTRGRGWSYGGHEKNRLYLNQRGGSFLESAFLMGVAIAEDCRCVVTDDLDGDGKPDLLVTTYEVWPEVKQTLRVYRNGMTTEGHWIGFQLREDGSGASPWGTTVTVLADGSLATRQLVTGDSHRAQHATTLHFGLGMAERVERAEIRWPDGRRTMLREPSLDRYHRLRASDASPSVLETK